MSYHANGRCDLPPARLLLVAGDPNALERFALLAWWENAAVECERAPRARVYCCQAGGYRHALCLALAAGCTVREVHHAQRRYEWLQERYA